MSDTFPTFERPSCSPSKTRRTKKRVSPEDRGGGDVDEGDLESPVVLEVS